MKNKILDAVFIFIVVGMFSFLGCYIYDRNTNYETHFETVTHVIINKESEQESTNNLGNFRTNYYLLLDSGELKDVELKEYMSLNIGDTISWIESYETRKTN